MHGIKLKSYEFNKYKSKNKITKFNFEILNKNKKINLNKNKRYDSKATFKGKPWSKKVKCKLQKS